MQAQTAAGAYEAAFAMTVPPPVIAANRSQLTTLVATNILGQNTAAIAATEAQYGEMWAQDVAAMENYAASSAAASNLSPFTSPTSTAQPADAVGDEEEEEIADGTGANSTSIAIVGVGFAGSEFQPDRGQPRPAVQPRLHQRRQRRRQTRQGRRQAVER